MVLMVAVVAIFNLASLLASLRLNKIINYVQLYKTSKSFLGLQTQPILHRVAVFQLIESDTREDTELFDEIFAEGNVDGNFINKPNSSGRTFLHAAGEKQASRKVLQLLNAGAYILPDSNGEGPKLAWLGLNGWPKGIQHVVESPGLLNLLQTWSSEDENEEAERRVVEKFVEDIKVLTIPLPASMGKEEMDGMKRTVQRWNNSNNHNTTKCEYPPVCGNNC